MQPGAMQPGQAHSLVLALRRAARNLVARRSIGDLEWALTQIVATAVDTVPGVDAGGISMTGTVTSPPAAPPTTTSASSTTSRPGSTKDPASPRSSLHPPTVSYSPRT